LKDRTQSGNVIKGVFGKSRGKTLDISLDVEIETIFENDEVMLLRMQTKVCGEKHKPSYFLIDLSKL